MGTAARRWESRSIWPRKLRHPAQLVILPIIIWAGKKLTLDDSRDVVISTRYLITVLFTFSLLHFPLCSHMTDLLLLLHYIAMF